MKQKAKLNKEDRQDYQYHLPVLLDEAVQFTINKKLETDQNSVIIDGTLGGGGHAAKLMQNFGGKLFAFDKDYNAIQQALITFEEEINTLSPRFVLFNQSFSKACSICDNRGIKPAGILLDLGVSSKQLDTSDNGISYRVNSQLDMRFDAKSNCANNITAKDILNLWSEDELTAMFRKYGEEPKSRAIARRIVEVRRVNALNTTFDLREIIEQCTPKIHHFKTLSRIFQAIRIEVNQELTELENTLNDIINILTPGGRIVVIAYHSLEDRIVKQIFKDNSFAPKQNKYTDSTSKTVPKLKLLTDKPLTPSDDEIKRNPRARSAKMRVAEKN
ncbi:MAG: 16S rRNA (cytosine(1402)-N(4))-methyltransferase RsmH [Ignavibacteria bacterium]|nr:16S rRNA (cytosine(1402)-N(4))-methyltransferase RsmH [Ignavibacteria bacterium]